MSPFFSALWAETLKTRRSMITPLTAGGFLLLPLAGGLFMVILKNPEQAREMGLISQKAQLTAGVADWPSFFGILSQGAAGLGAIVFSMITAWVFGREFSDHTAKELLALPTRRSVIIGAKFLLIALWALSLSIVVFLCGFGVGAAVDIPGWSAELGWATFWLFTVMAVMTIMLMPLVAFFASLGRGYLPPLGWTVLTLALANLSSVLGWGDWFPWAVPLVASKMIGSHANDIAPHSYWVVVCTMFVGLALTFGWWQRADQAR
jgi:ABC-2 type transport system permease protein